ncbi:MAG: hypothetical protein K9J17_01510 [Flavobacteriales bacterium]|nr:hypothetical protein [Flavobacteriales bacterium]
MTLVLDGFLIAFIVAFGWKNLRFSERFRQLTRIWPKSTNLFLGLFVAYCTLMAVEFSCRFYFKHGYKAPYSEQTFWEPGACERDSILGSRLPKDATLSHAYVVNDSLIYKQYYHTDAFGRRITPQTKPDSIYQEFAMVAGCSFAFGYGLNDHETLSYFLDSITSMRGYNYGVSGHGTQQTLTLLQTRDLHEEIIESNGILIHLFIDDHIKRMIGSRRLIKLWAINFPYYYLDGDELKRDGSFWTGRHLLTRFYRAISQSAFLDLFDIDIPWCVSDAHVKLFGAIVRQSKAEFLKQYPNGRFILVIGPNSKLAGRIMPVLKSNKVEVLDLSSLLDKEQKKYKIHWTEGHPNANYYLEMAKAIKTEVNTSEPDRN